MAQLMIDLDITLDALYYDVQNPSRYIPNAYFLSVFPSLESCVYTHNFIDNFPKSRHVQRKTAFQKFKMI